MPREKSAAAPRDLGLYVRELRLSLRNNAGAYGFSVMITSVMATLSAISEPPDVVEVILFFLGAIACFAIVEVCATRGFTRSLDDTEGSTVIALGSSLHLASIAGAVGLAAGAGHVLPAPLPWLVGPFLASLTYLLVTVAEMAIARRVQEARNEE